jgi:DNA-binding transcriptional regulator YiaG
MSPEALRAALAALRLSQMDAARLLRVDGRTMRRWLAGERAMPGPAVLALELVGRLTEAERAALLAEAIEA